MDQSLTKDQVAFLKELASGKSMYSIARDMQIDVYDTFHRLEDISGCQGKDNLLGWAAARGLLD